MGVMRAIASWGLPVSDDLQVFPALEQVIDHYRGIERRRADLPFDIAGVVYKVNRLPWQQRLGQVAPAPRLAIAHNVPADRAPQVTTAIDIQAARPRATTTVAP